MELKLTDLVPLPSKGKLYPPNHPFHNKEEVEIRYLTAADEDILTTKSLLKNGEIFNRIISEVVLDKSLNPNSLLVGDRDAILIYTRILSLGSEYKASGTCKYCDSSDKYTFDISNVPMKYLELVPEVENENRFKFTTSFDNKIEFQFPTIELVKKIQKTMELKEKALKKAMVFNGIDSTATTTYKELILSINGETDRAKIGEFIDKNMPLKEIRELSKFYSENQPKIEFVSDFYCKNCGQTNEEVLLDFNPTFFWTEF